MFQTLLSLYKYLKLYQNSSTTSCVSKENNFKNIKFKYYK